MRKILTLMAATLALAATAQIPSATERQRPARSEETHTPDYGDFTIDAQVRARGGVRNEEGTQTDGSSKSKLFVNDRVRLSFGWERKNLSMKIAAQHTGVWHGSSGQNTSGNIGLHEAWAKMTFGKGFFGQVGRQELSYDDGRLLGAHDWAPTGRAHDGLRVAWENTRHKLHAIIAFNQTAEATDEVSTTKTSSSTKLYKNMEALWYHFGNEQKPFQISALLMNQGVGDAKGDGVNYMQTFGTYATYEKKKLSANASFYFQTGSDRTGTTVSAFMMSGNFGWQFSPKWSASIGDEYLSGGDGMPGTNHTFNVLYGSHHNFLGAMDYFGYGTIPDYGINDLKASANFLCSQKFDMGMSCHWFVTGRPINDYLKDPVEQLTDPEKIKIMRRYNGKYRFSQNLGTEIDLNASIRPIKDITIEAGYSMMLTTETMEFLKDGAVSGLQHWAWVSFDINPTLFTTRRHQ